jgi:hypothetical protein
MSMLCHACGSPIRDAALSCPKCGVLVEHSAPEYEDDPDQTILMPLTRAVPRPAQAQAPAEVDYALSTPAQDVAQAEPPKAMPEWIGPTAAENADFPTAKRSPPMRFIALGVFGLVALVIIVGAVWRIVARPATPQPASDAATAAGTDTAKPEAIPAPADGARPDLPVIPPVAAPESSAPALAPGGAGSEPSSGASSPAALPASAGLPLNAPRTANTAEAAPRERATTSTKPSRARNRPVAANRDTPAAATGDGEQMAPRPVETPVADKPGKTLDDLLK